MPDSTPSTEWKEVPLEDEEKQFASLVEKVAKRISDIAHHSDDKVKRRGFHAKIHAGVMGEFQVLPSPVAAAKFGLFAQPAVYPAFVRFSNGQSDLSSDEKPQPRGIAVKLVGVPGGPEDRLEEAKDAMTQDFLGTSHSLTSIVRDAVQFFAVLDITERKGSLSDQLRQVIADPGEAARIVFRLSEKVLLPRVDSLATEHYSSTAPLQCGPFALKFVIHPPADVTAARHERDENHLRHELASRLRTGDVRLDFSVQFFVDPVHTPIEDTSVEWPDHVAPLHKVAELRIPRWDIDSPEGRELTALVDQLSFFPWHGLKAHRPLGNVMRARRLAYPRSAQLRTFLGEPTRVDGGGSLAEGGTAKSLREAIRVPPFSDTGRALL
jgi:hypothetical protein